MIPSPYPQFGYANSGALSLRRATRFRFSPATSFFTLAPTMKQATYLSIRVPANASGLRTVDSDPNPPLIKAGSISFTVVSPYSHMELLEVH